MSRGVTTGLGVVQLMLFSVVGLADDDQKGHAFFERKIRPLLVEHCYECHSEAAEEQQGGLLLDRQSGWLKGGDRNKAVIPGDPDASPLIRAVRYRDEDLQMPPEYQLDDELVHLLENWVRRGAPGPAVDLGDTEFSRLGDQGYLFEAASNHWAFQLVKSVAPPAAGDLAWNEQAIDQFIFARLQDHSLTPSQPADARTLIRRLTYDLTGLPPTPEAVEQFVDDVYELGRVAYSHAVERLINSPAFGEHLGRMWLDVARYADTDSFYRPDTVTPHYFPFAFTYRDYVVEAFNNDKPFDQFVREQLAADLIGFSDGDAEMAALGFLAVGPHANRNPTEALDDWIDVTTRGLMGMTAACARCHDHKYEPIPTADYYSLHGVFASIVRPNSLDENQLPTIPGYPVDSALRADYLEKRAAIDAKIAEAGDKTVGSNQRGVARKIRETELAYLLLFHRGGPVHSMIVKERGKPVDPYIYVRGDPTNQGDRVPRRFLQILDPKQQPFPDDSSGRIQLANKIASSENPLTARVFVNRVFGLLMGQHLVDTPSDFGLQGSAPTHPLLLDWLADDFVSHGWSVKHLVRRIVLSETYRQASHYREEMASIDSENRYFWRANRKHLSIEAIRDSALVIANRLDSTPRGRAAPLWGDDYTKRRAIYGYINRFNLDPTLRVFDFPTPMQTQPGREESIVAPQALFTMNAPFVIDQAAAITALREFASRKSNTKRVETLFQLIFQREPTDAEVNRISRFVEQQQRLFASSADESEMPSPWEMVAQSLLMSNEFQYID